ncbi:MAG TPA: hypothetical protein VNW23_07475 [Opitutaceae bacterium]|nr:hypothetical protein [Opitutaceae bacterium]
MKESRFIELINLYIDRQISPEEAAELEAEIARSPAHRRTYLQYCRMHRACTVLFENLHVPAAPLAKALSQAEGKVTAFPTRGYSRVRIALGVGLAAAACLALVLVNHSISKDNSLPAAKPALTEMAQVDVPPESFHTAVVIPAARPPEFQTVFVANKLSLASNQAASDERRAALNWMNQIELSPMPAVENSEMVFEPQSTTPSPDQRFQRENRDGQPAAQMTAFEFQP